MNILTIDTSTGIELISVAVKNNIRSIAKKTGHSHAATLFSNIDTLLHESSVTIRDIELIGVGTGPGSFTGIRIAVTTARTLAQALDIPLIGIHSHELFAASVDSADREIMLIAFDARKNRVFAALYQKQKDRPFLKEILQPGDYTVEQLITATDNNKVIYAAGDGVLKFEKELTDGIRGIKIMRSFLPSGEAASITCRNKYLHNPELNKNFNAVLPVYARKSDAEILFKPKGAGKQLKQ